MVDVAMGIGSFLNGVAKGVKSRREQDEREEKQELLREANERDRLRLQREIQRQDEMRPGEMEIQRLNIDNLRTSGQNASEAGVQAGNTQLAQAYRPWLQDRNVQEGVRLYSDAVGKWGIGDVDGALDSLAAAYSVRGYLDDGRSLNILRKNRDPVTGNISTVDVEFVSNESGEKSRQTVSIDGLMNYATHVLSPAEVAKMGIEHYNAEKKAKEGLEQKRAEARIELEKERQKVSMGSNPYATGGFNEGQGKAATFADRMAQADAIISQNEDINSGVGGWAGGVAVNNLPDGLTNQFTSPERQQIIQGQSNFVNAILRRESGAAISRSEFDNAARQYFPQPGDSAEVIAQKRENRRSAIAGIMREAGPGYRPPQGWENPGNPAQGGGQAAPQGGQAAPQAAQRGGGQAPQAAQAGTGGDRAQAIMGEARAAIARGADPAAVAARLRQLGITQGGF